MMKAKDLRIGNYLSSSKRLHKVVSLNQNDMIGLLCLDTDSIISDSKFLEPIPLTEEWLIKFGFEKKPNRAYKKYWKDFGDMAILVDEDFDFYIHGESYEGETLRNVEYVHILQNLYYALTGEELTINE